MENYMDYLEYKNYKSCLENANFTNIYSVLLAYFNNLCYYISLLNFKRIQWISQEIKIIVNERQFKFLVPRDCKQFNGPKIYINSVLNLEDISEPEFGSDRDTSKPGFSIEVMDFQGNTTDATFILKDYMGPEWNFWAHPYSVKSFEHIFMHKIAFLTIEKTEIDLETGKANINVTKEFSRDSLIYF